ncbi:hypothetical protein LTR70_003123 [Exophiala xenobiotica]|uniref:Uncharacterized protein n=1 Tax=Lithohypha guttulata TaxID=1690604 RepID=A0ABR0KHE4_9EURO|nr:hypothetical protein LTR24_002645 [Lithohypha guttulata]KAK5323834.1 hypothetical protein LTR70_003123 [Exophiala xenobiotica]
MPSKARPGRGVYEVLEELGLGSKQANELLRTQLLAYNDVHDRELTQSLGDDYDELPLDVSLTFLNSHGAQFFGAGRSKWLWPEDSAALVGRVAEIMRRQHAYKRDPTRKRGRSKSPDSTASRSTKSSRRTGSRNRDGSDFLFPAFPTDIGNTRRNSLLPSANDHVQLRSQEHDDDTIVARPRFDRASRRSGHVSAALPARPTTQHISQPPFHGYPFVSDTSVATPTRHPLPQNPTAHVISTSSGSAPRLTSFVHPGNRRFSAMSEETQSTEQTFSPSTAALTHGGCPAA